MIANLCEQLSCSNHVINDVIQNCLTAMNELQSLRF